MERNRQSLDMYDEMPPSMKAYFRNYGKHFNTKMYEFAVSGMKKSNGEKVNKLEKERYDNMLKQYGITLENDIMCDGMFVMSMAISDFYGKSLKNEQQLVQFVKDYVDDYDQVDGFIFNRFFSDCVLKGIPINWDEML